MEYLPLLAQIDVEFNLIGKSEFRKITEVTLDYQ